MANKPNFDVIIIGGSYAGLSAAMTLGRSLRDVLVIDAGNPCNKQTPHSHNFLTQDGRTPHEISKLAKSQVLAYDTIKFLEGKAIYAQAENNEFSVGLQSGENFIGKKLLFTMGVKDIMPPIQGFAECWGISVLHCPYCHGYEVKQEKIGLLSNGDFGFEFTKLISHWTKDLILFTNGKSTLSPAQVKILEQRHIKIIEKEISALEHHQGQLERIIFKDNSSEQLKAIFSKAGFEQHCDLPQQLGCNLTEQGYIEVDDFQRTSVEGIYAAGDNTTMFRTVSLAVSSGTKAGVVINKTLIEEAFA